MNNQTQPASAPTKLEKLRRLYFQVLIGCLLAAASVAVVAVLAGGFTDILGRSLLTILMVAIHTLLSFNYITVNEKRAASSSLQLPDIFSQAVFGLIVLSFITSIFGVWEVLDKMMLLRCYLLYAVLLFAILHAEALYLIRGFEKKINQLTTANFFLMAIVVLLLSILIFSPSFGESLGALYFRILAALGIIDATMTLTAIILHKLYTQKHPEVLQAATEQTKAKSSPVARLILTLVIIYVSLQVVLGLIALAVGSLR